jgi:hypothetical protein
VKKILVPQRLNPVINRLNKTRVEISGSEVGERGSAEGGAEEGARAVQERRKEEARVARTGRRRLGRRITRMMICSRRMR